MKNKYLILSYIFLGLGIGVDATAANSEVKASAPLQAKSGVKGLKGKVSFREVATKGVELVAEIEGLKPGSVHGFHIHEKGDCSSPDAKSAGDHFNPTKKAHGDPHSSPAFHIGDLGNVTADSNGKISLTKTFNHLSLEPKNPNNILKRAVVLHAKPDDLKTQPSGDSGDRIACGVIEL